MGKRRIILVAVLSCFILVICFILVVLLIVPGIQVVGGDVIVFGAHRGNSVDFIENTIPAF